MSADVPRARSSSRKQRAPARLPAASAARPALTPDLARTFSASAWETFRYADANFWEPAHPLAKYEGASAALALQAVARVPGSQERGVFASGLIARDALLSEYTGRLLRPGERAAEGGRYLMEWTTPEGRTLAADAARAGCVARFYNHSDRPNVAKVPTGDHLLLYASRDIARGEQLSLDYGGAYDTEHLDDTGSRGWDARAELVPS